MKREHIEQAVRDLASQFPLVPPAEWLAIVEEATTVRAEVDRLEELPLADVEPIFLDLRRR